MICGLKQLQLSICFIVSGAVISAWSIHGLCPPYPGPSCRAATDWLGCREAKRTYFAPIAVNSDAAINEETLITREILSRSIFLRYKDEGGIERKHRTEQISVNSTRPRYCF